MENNLQKQTNKNHNAVYLKQYCKSAILQVLKMQKTLENLRFMLFYVLEAPLQIISNTVKCTKLLTCTSYPITCNNATFSVVLICSIYTTEKKNKNSVIVFFFFNCIGEQITFFQLTVFGASQ